ncbi:S46 family peptidase [Salibacteraceae bacterium]|nr:S46 family peptidase [Salibacteraceae bacterium]
MIKKFLLLITLSISLQASSTEGMWVPGMINKLVSGNMESMGMKVSLDDLYAINNSSIKDAVVHFNGGCTSVLVSDQGLLLTNHHCGYSRIQSHSSLEKNYLKDGFWAMSLTEELSNPGMDASIIKEIRDVTDLVLADLSVDASEAERKEHLKKVSGEIIEKAKEETGLDVYIKPFYHGNQYLLFISEIFTDIRLVGAPPSSIGKYGFDTDNWVWPRHTGDFSVFRIYANRENKPADFSEENRPYQPKHFLTVNIQGVEENDYTLVYGFPGTTENYITEVETKNILETVNPLRLKMREASLSVIDEAMRKDELTKIQYAAKQSRISNAYKKWIGQTKGLVRHRVLDKKDSVESLFTKRINENPDWKSSYSMLIAEMEEIENAQLPLSVNRNYFIEFYYMGPEIFRFTEKYRELAAMCKDETITDEAIDAWIAEHSDNSGYFKNYDTSIDGDIMKAQIEYFVEDQKPLDFLNNLKTDKESLTEFVDRLYDESIFNNEASLNSFFDGFKRKNYKKIEADPAYEFSLRLAKFYSDVTRPGLLLYVTKSDSLMRIWMDAQMKVLPERTYSPDANGTLRITFGKVEGYEPFDGAEYAYYTTLEGVMEKEDPTNPEYNVPARLKELYQKKDYGRYAHSTGEMRVAFVASNHTSGGNSGSPVIDANGNLIGLNFDRTWESTMSDIMFNPIICRNISVDIRYVLFIMDKYAGAKHLVDEMKLISE